jgi:iron complex transport system substrate-binding protein
MKKRLTNKMTKVLAVILAAGLLVTGCGSGSSSASSADETESSTQDVTSSETSTENTESEESDESVSESTGEVEKVQDDSAPTIDGLTYEGSLSLKYAEKFKVHYYEGGYKLIEVVDDASYLIVPEDGEAPDGLDSSIQVIYQPLENVYLAATSAMSLFSAIDGIDCIKYSGTKADGWYVDAAKTAMENGEMTYAGKYSEPDYELLLDGNCDLAIESTMILHTPKVQEMLEELGIPVFTDRSSYESNPMGRTEWVKCYAAMLNKEADAEAFFDEREKAMEEADTYEKTDLKVAFFYVDTSGSIVVRNNTDYIAKMIEMAGADYTYSDVFDDSEGKANITVSMEQFYDVALDADYLIYNASINQALTSVDDLLSKSDLFADFKAVKEGHVYTTGKSLYQATDHITDFVKDVHKIISGDDSDYTFISKVE